jgi:multiple sugar transport system permease protein
MAGDTRRHSTIDRSAAVAVPAPRTRELALRVHRGPATQWWKIPVVVVLALGALAVVFPFVWMVATSVKPEPEVITYPPHLFPHQWTLESYINIWPSIGFGRLALNSIVFAGGVTAISLFLDSMTAYALARLRFPGREILFWLVLATLMVPFQVLLIPVYVEVYNLGWLDTLFGLIIPRATNGFGIFMLRQFFSGLPREYDEAARLDGASEWFIYRRITLPLSVPALMTLGIFHFTFNWNDFLWPLVITSSADMRTIPAGLALFTGQHEVQYSLLMAGAVLTMLPLLIAFIFLQRYFVQGISLTGFK